MTDNDIIKALECCGIKSDCIGCYFNTHEAEDICAREIVKKAFDLINRQRAEIERLKKYNTEVAYKHYNDGIKEFAEKLKENITKSIDNYWNSNANGYYLAEDVLEEIDILVKEMIDESIVKEMPTDLE